MLLGMMLLLLPIQPPGLCDEVYQDDGYNQESSEYPDGLYYLGSGDSGLSVSVQEITDQGFLDRLDTVRDAIYLCCACVMFTGGAVIGLHVVRVFWYVE